METVGNQFNGPIVRSYARVGANATIIAGVTIGRGAIVGARAVVTKDIPDNKLALGVPARIIKDVPREQQANICVATLF